jgi:hypothetical protein
MAVDWKQAWDHFIVDPVPFGSALIFLVGAAWTGAWLFRANIAKGLEDGLRGQLAVDLPLNFHPVAIRASAVDTPFGAG